MGRIFEHAEQFLGQCDPGEFLEIGTSRQGDDGSTVHISQWATERGTKLTTVDIDPQNCEFVRNKNLPNVTIINTTGEEYLRTRTSNSPISFLYLDNFDWDHHPDHTEAFVIDQQKRYAELGFTMNNVNCQIAHLMQAELVLPHMAEKCVIACDDTPFNRWWGHYSGKCGAAVPFLIGHGFNVIFMDTTKNNENTGVILARGFK